MIRIRSRRYVDMLLARQRKADAARYASAVETLLPESCTHRDRLSCPVCATRRAVYAAARAVRETAWQQRGESRDA